MHTHRTHGQSILEYAILIALLAVVVISIAVVLGRKTRDVYCTVNDAMITASVEFAGNPEPPPPPVPWWQPFVKQKYDQYVADGLPSEVAFNNAMGDLAGEAGGHGVGPGDMPGLFHDASGWLGGQIGGGP